MQVRISGNQLTLEGSKLLQGLPKLESIICYAPLSDEELVRLSEVSQLREVIIQYDIANLPPQGDRGLIALKRLPKLESLGFGCGRNIDSPPDSVLLEWATIPTLKALAIGCGESRRKYTEVGIAKFRELRPDIELRIDGVVYQPITLDIPTPI